MCSATIKSELHAHLSVPSLDVSNPELTILVPTLNEEVSITQFVNWCHEGLRRSQVQGEILIVDSSSDQTAQLALAAGARVLTVPKRGLGQAYKDALPFVRGKFVIMGDADCTYDFRVLEPFIRELRAGAELVMGSRFRGSIEKNAMPIHHRFFGTPGTTFIANLVLGISLSDIHCGMRAMPTTALKSLGIQSSGWEYASEMIVSARRLNYKIREVPIDFYRDLEGRISNVKRQGWVTPYRVGWKTIQILFAGGADFFLIPPGIIFSVLGSLGLVALALGPIHVGEVLLSLHAHTFFLMIGALGYIILVFGLSLRCICDRSGALVTKLGKVLSFNRTTGLVFLLAIVGVSPVLLFATKWINAGLKVGADLERLGHGALSGLGLCLLANSVFVLMLAVQAIQWQQQAEREIRNGN